MRVYLPSTLLRLRGIVAAGQVGPAPLAGWAVTPALREWYVEGDLEELEYAALTAAAAASLRLLAEDTAAPRRRVVLAADAPAAVVAPGTADPGTADRAAVLVRAVVPLVRLAAVHVDDPAATATVGEAVRALPAADQGDADAGFLLDEAASHELQWYASSEIFELVGLAQ
jgi:hypothetical protein